jgi:1-phosphofructokinase
MGEPRGHEGAIAVFAPVTILTVTLERTADGESEVHVHPGGQGVWQARMAASLGARTVLCTLLGGEPGIVISALLEAEGLERSEVDLEAPNATWIQDRRGGERETWWEGDPPVPGRHALDGLYSAALGAGLACGVCVLAGTHEAGAVDVGTYRRLAGDLRAAGVQIVADLTGDELDAVLESAPDVVKVSDEDMRRDGRLGGNGRADVEALVAGLHDDGARRVVVSCADAGALASDGTSLHDVRQPLLDVADARGAGDSMTAALAVGLSRGLSWPDVLRLGAAAAALNVTRHGSGSGRADAVMELAKRVTVEARAA